MRPWEQEVWQDQGLIATYSESTVGEEEEEEGVSGTDTGDGN